MAILLFFKRIAVFATCGISEDKCCKKLKGQPVFIKFLPTGLIYIFSVIWRCFVR